MNTHTIIFTDGSSSGNPGPGGWAAILVLPTDLVQELGGREDHTTNNRMELQAVISALTFLGNMDCDVTIHTDSSYVIQGITKWVKGWVKNNWITSTKTDVVNRDLWERLIEIMGVREELGKVTWKHIAGHAGIPGNERADEIATTFTEGKEIELFKGTYVSKVDGEIQTHQTWVECENRVKGKSGAKFKKALSEIEEKQIIQEWS
jgi:ribonuclease HI